MEHVCHRHKNLHRINCVRRLPHKTQIIFMVEIKHVVLLLVPSSSQQGRYIARIVFLRKVFRTSNILLILNTTILCKLHVIMLIIEMQIIAISSVRTKRRSIHMRSGLAVIISLPVHIVKNSTEIKVLTHISSKSHLHMIISRSLVSASIVSNIHKRRLSIIESELVGFHKELIHRIKEHKLVLILTFHKNSVDTRRAQITQMVKVAVHTLRQVIILILMV